MELRHLEAVDAVIEAGSFTAAARRRHISQPALWAQVRALEEELGFALFERVGRGIKPTAACLALQPRVRGVLDGAAAVASLSAEIRSGRTAPARIGCAQYHVAFFLADVIADLARRAPGSPFPEIVPVSSADATAKLERREVDLVVQPRVAAPSYAAHRLYSVFVAAVGPAVRGPTLDVRALDRLPVATFPRDSGVRVTLEEACRVARVSVEVVCESRDAATVLALAARGLATAVVISEAVPPGVKAAKLVSGGRPFATELMLMWRTDAALTPAAVVLRDAMIARARRLGGGRPLPSGGRHRGAALR